MIYSKQKSRYLYELNFTSELVPGNINWEKVVQFSNKILNRRGDTPRTYIL